MENRKGFKEVMFLARKCFKETGPKSLEVRRVKGEKVKQFGFPPVVLRSKPIVQYIVIADYSEQFRVYFFSNLGQSLGGKNYDKPSDIKKEIAKRSNLIKKFPRKQRS